MEWRKKSQHNDQVVTRAKFHELGIIQDQGIGDYIVNDINLQRELNLLHAKEDLK